MGSLNTAFTRLGVGGSSINYSRPFLAKVGLTVFVARFIGILESADIEISEFADIIITPDLETTVTL